MGTIQALGLERIGLEGRHRGRTPGEYYTKHAIHGATQAHLLIMHERWMVLPHSC